LNQSPVNSVPQPADAAIGGEVAVNSYRPNWQTAPVITTLADGSYVIVWRSLEQDGSGWGIYSQRYDQSGAPAGPETRVNTTTFSGQDLPSVAALSGGGYVIAWSSAAAGEATYFQRYDSAGSPVGGETLAASVYSGMVASLAGGDFLIAWTASTGAYAQRFDSSGTALGGPALLGPATNSNPVGQLSIIGLAGGGYVATWTSSNGPDDTDVYARQFDSSGQALAPEFLISTATGPINNQPDVAALADGGYVIGWKWVDFDEGSAVYARRYDSAGLQVGTELLLDESSDVNGVAAPRLAGLGGGGFVISWSADVAGTPQVFAQRFDSASAAEGAAVRINSSNHALGPDVTAVGLDSYIVAWSSFPSTQLGFEVLAQRRGPAVQAVEDSNLVFSTAVGNAISVSDADAASLTITLSAARGTLTLSGTAGLAFTAGDGTADSTMTFSGTAAAINAALDGLVYRGPPDGMGTDSLTISTTDDGNGDPGAALTDTDTIEIFLADDHFIPGDSGSNTLDGTSMADLFSLEQGGDDIAHGLGGNDVFLFGAAMTSADEVDGGAGIDQIAIQGDYSGPNALTLGSGVTNFESLAILPGNDIRFGDPGTNFYDYNITTVNANVAPGVQLIVDANRLRVGEDFTFNGSAELDGGFFIWGGGGVDTLTGGSMTDIFYFGENGQFGASDTVNGGGGTDQLGLRGNYTIVFGAGQLSGIENIGLVSAQDTRFGALGSTFNYNLTMNDANVASGVLMTVDGAALRNGETLTFNGSAETNGLFRIFGGQGSDVITTGAGADIIQGGRGADDMTGGGGADTFRYITTLDSTGAAMDEILDFAPGTDKIDLARIDANTLAGGDQAFSWIGSNAFTGSGAASAGELRAYQDNGIWFVEGDTDGNGVADLVIAVTTQSGAPLVQGDFVP
jgi:Ca2+-binding RTX toxin-like protein